MTNAPLPCENKRLTFYPSRATDIDKRDMNVYMSHQQNVTLIRTDTTGAMVSLRKFSSIQPFDEHLYSTKGVASRLERKCWDYRTLGGCMCRKFELT